MTATGPNALQAALAHVLWIGGATDSGKTSVARALAAAHGWEVYHYDRYDRVKAPGHLSRIDPARHPYMDASRNKSLEDRWVNTTPEEMLDAWLQSTAERFEFVLEDLRAVPPESLTVAEGYGLLPELVAPLLSSAHQAIWLVSDERFKRESYARRTALGEKGTLWAQLSDPQRARENHIGRDLLIAAHIRQRARERELTVVEIDGAKTLDEVVDDVRTHLAPYFRTASVAQVRANLPGQARPLTMPEATRYVSVPNATLWSVRSGSGPPLVLLHGGPGMADYLEPVAAMVEDVAAVHRYDQRGVGRSAGGPPFDVATAVADLDAVRVAWGVERWTVLGHSWGASLALAYAVAHPERTSGLIYVSGTGVDLAWHAAYRDSRIARLDVDEQRRWHELRALRKSANGDELRAIEREYAALYAATDVADKSRAADLVTWLHARGFPVNQEVNRVLGEDASRTFETATFAESISRLEVPTLVIHGARDPRPVRFAERVASLIPHAEMVILNDVGHVPPFEDPHTFAAAVRAFLSTVAAA